MRPENLRDDKNQIGRGRSFRKLAIKSESDNLRRHHINRLPQHARLGLNSTHAPAKHSQPVDHRRMAVRADEAVRKRHAILHRDHFRQVFQVHLMHNPGGGGNNT